MSRLLFVSVLCGGWLMHALAVADSTLIYEEGGRQHLVRIASGKVRLDPHRGRQWFLFDSQRRDVRMVDPEKREFRVIDEDKVASLRLQLDGAIRSMEDQLARLPPSLQDLGRRGLAGMVPLERGTRAVRLQPTGQRGTASGLGCVYQQLIVDGKAKAELCLTAASSLGLPPEDLAAVLAGQALARSLAEKADRFFAVDEHLFGDSDQVPLIYRPRGSPKGWTLMGIAHTPVEPGLLELPAGYRERPLGLPLL